MLYPTEYTANLTLIETAVAQTNFEEFKVTLNQQTGDFFYDSWKIKPEFKGTVWEQLLNSLPEQKGEARVITLKPGTTYYCHADMDDRWHLNLQSEHGYLCDLENDKLYKLVTDGLWYSMDAGRLHTAANFGNKDRVQLVVRKLLTSNVLKNPVFVKIILKINTPDFRYQFDQKISIWLNRANKNRIISNFSFNNTEVKFNIEQEYVEELKSIVPDIFEVV